MKSEEINQIIRTNLNKSDEELSQMTGTSIQGVKNRRSRIVRTLSTKDQIEADKKIVSLKSGKQAADKKYKAVLEENDRLQRELEAVIDIKETPQTFEIKPNGTHKSEATAFLIASDWHIEEEVNPSKIDDLNSYNLDIARERATAFFRNGLTLLRLFQKHGQIDTLVLGLLGDFISGNIHEELLETSQLGLTKACREVQSIIKSGIDFLLENSEVNLIIPCNSGNHSRVTKDRRIATESDNSLEWYMYHNIADHYDTPRVTFMIAEGYFLHLNVYGDTIRFHHGHHMKYNGGVGGIYIPVNKAIGQWNKAKRVDLDVFGHWHQQRDGGNFISNGSLIGYNAYAQSIKADYEPPKQAFFLWDRDHDKSIVAPVFLR